MPRLVRLIFVTASGVLLTSCTSNSGGTDGSDQVAAAQAATGSGQTGEAGAALGAPIVIYVTDGNSHGKSGVTVEITVTAGTVTPASASTGSDGKTSFTWTLGDVTGTQTFTAHVAGLDTPVTVTAVATAPALILAAETGDNQGGIVGLSLAQPIVLRVTRVHDGAAVANVPLTLTAAGGGTLDPTSVSTGSDGRATAAWTLGSTVGPQSFTVSGPSLTTLTVNATASAAPNSLAVDSGNAQTGEVGAALARQIVARVTKPSDGTGVAGVTVSFAVATGGGSVSAATGVTDVNGRARVTWTLGPSTGAQTLTIGAPGVTGQTVTATATPEAHILLLLSGSDQVGASGTVLAQPIVIKVARARDSVGVAGVTVNFSVTAGGGSVDHAAVTSATDGTAGVKWTLGASATQTLQASSTGLTSVNVSAIVGSALTNIVQLSTGDEQVCATNSAGAIYCWGSDNYDQLGIPGYLSYYSPSPLLIPSGSKVWAQASAGTYTSCGRTTAGVAYCWGDNNYGTIGNGTTTSTPNATAVTSSGQVWAQLVGGSYFNCGRTIANVAWCWGDDSYGELGDGGLASEHDSPIMVSGGLQFTQLTTSGADGDGYTACGLAPDGSAYCWGYNGYGEFGDGTTTDKYVPTAVAGGHHFAAIAAGPYHTCGVLLGGAGTMCWGYNGYGELGDGTTTDQLTPVMVHTALTFVEVTAGYETSCGLTAAGAAYCWGSGDYGEIGNGAYNDSNDPMPVAGGHVFAHLASGYQFTCAPTTGGLVYCWGDNLYGQLGNDVDDWNDLPTLVGAPEGTDVRQRQALRRTAALRTRRPPHTVLPPRRP
jgi:alpha-tubulin suppressor-like RCC1 family protein